MMQAILLIILAIAVDIGIAIMFGCIARKICNDKGYQNEGFWWGFFLGVIGLIVVACKSENPNRYSSALNNSNSYSSQLHSLAEEAEKQRRGYQGTYDNKSTNSEWKCCVCGTVNPKYVTTCTCGNSSFDNERKRAEMWKEREEREAAERERAEKEKAEKERAEREREEKERADKEQAEREREDKRRAELISAADALMKYKTLHEEGVITDEEFEEMKKSLLTK